MYNELYYEKEFYNLAKPILRNTEFQRRKTYLHHNDSVYEHSLKVAYTSFKIAKFISKYKKINIQNVVIGALLHDFYITPWREYECSNFFKKHGFVHGNIASYNSSQFFTKLMNERIENAIKRHMFPLTIIPPRYIEGWIITTADKYVSFEVFKNPKELPKYVGIKLTKEILLSKCKQLYKVTNNFVSHIV